MIQSCPFDIPMLLNVAVEAAQRAGEILRKGYGTSFKVSIKSGKQNLVTEYDKKAEECIISFLKSHSPSHIFLGEESGLSSHQKEDEEVLWIIDPLDGTTNFARQIPFFCVSIAATWKDFLLCGVVYQPMSDELFYASYGSGTFLNGHQIHVSSTDQIEKAVLATGFPHEEDSNYDEYMSQLHRLLKFSPSIRDVGSAALHLAYLASGRCDAFWIPSAYSWDVAAGQILVEEAGGRVTHLNGSPLKAVALPKTPFDLLGTNSALHNTMLRFLQQ